MRSSFAILTSAALLAAASMLMAAGKPGEGKLDLTITDRETGQVIPCRVHLKNPAGVPQKVLKMPFWHDHFVCPGVLNLTLRKGQYTFFIERGPEYPERYGHFILRDFGEDAHTIDLPRAANMASENWWSGDLNVHRSVRDIELAMQADDLHVAPLIVWTNKPLNSKKPATSEAAPTETPASRAVEFDTDRYYEATAGEDRRAGGGVRFFHLDKPLALPEPKAATPTSIDLVLEAKQQPRAWIDADVLAPDLPLWLATGKVDSIQVIGQDFLREKMQPKAVAGKLPKQPLTDAADVGEWAQRVYWNVLESGLRIPPTAGSGSGVSPNPLGYNRAYVWADKERFDYDIWWESLRAGRALVTNGPLPRPHANGRPPGHQFRASESNELSIDVAMNLTIRDQVKYLEVIRNGQLIQSRRLEDWAKTGHFEPFTVRESGWFLVRVATEVKDTFRFATTGPWYVEAADQPLRVSRKAAQFFFDCVEERAAAVAKDAALAVAYAPHLAAARAFWQQRLAGATAD